MYSKINTQITYLKTEINVKATNLLEDIILHSPVVLSELLHRLDHCQLLHNRVQGKQTSDFRSPHQYQPYDRLKYCLCELPVVMKW